MMSRSDAEVWVASSGSQFVEPAVYAPQNTGNQAASSIIPRRAASLACLTVIVCLSLLTDPDMSHSPLQTYSSNFDSKHPRSVIGMDEKKERDAVCGHTASPIGANHCEA